jgi:hypothetical protein
MRTLAEIRSLAEGRVKIVKIRVRKNKIQRRRRVSNVKGYTMRNSIKNPTKLTRMMPTEKRRRKMGQRRGKIKRRTKMTMTKMKRNRSMRKRKALGL